MLKGGKGVSPGSIDNYVAGGSERSQHISNLKYEGYIHIPSQIMPLKFINNAYHHPPI
ncbi:hypothetical protein T050_001550 [Salmonella enterica]|nr:hypothetical protein [Salmonella enterica subsp. enterica]EEJ1823244.1 hypothetical protein [Salmonella enterica]